MSLSNDAREKIQPGPLVCDPWNVLALAIVVLQILIAVMAFPFLPAIVPIHWNAAGHANEYASKWVNTLLFPALSIGLYLLLRFVAIASPRLGGRASRAANAQLMPIILVTILLFELILQCTVTAISLGLAVDIGFVMNLILALLFIVIGNFMGKMRRNFWMGIRTPWTLASDVTWERTHRLGGWLFVALGLLAIPCSFIPRLRLWFLLVGILLVAVLLYAYSYWIYQQNTVEGHEPVSPPFDEAHEE